MDACSNCKQILDATDRFCRACGSPAHQGQIQSLFRRQLTPEDAASYWRGFFRPFFIVAFAFLGIFIIWATTLLVIWYFMFHR
jgi:hypothetical protein